MHLEQWRAEGNIREVFGRRIFYREAGPLDAPRVLLLHGFPSSSYDFHRVVGALERSYRVVAHDHVGFGFSAKPKTYSYSLIEQADTALGLWRQLGIKSGHIVAHDYGTSIATELVARRERGLLPIELRSLTLSNGSLYLDLAKLRPSQKILRSRLLGPIFARAITRGMFERILRRLWANPEAVQQEDLEGMWTALVANDGRDNMPAASIYLKERRLFLARWAQALSRSDLSTLVLWGEEDPIARPVIARRIADEVPRSRLVFLPGVGHYPMLEAPDRWRLATESFLGALD